MFKSVSKLPVCGISRMAVMTFIFHNKQTFYGLLNIDNTEEINPNESITKK